MVDPIAEPITGADPITPAEPAIPAVNTDPTPLPGDPALTPTPGADPAPADPQADPTGEKKTVPISALHEERTKRQEAQAELEILRQIAGDNVLFDINGKPVANTAMPGQQTPANQQPVPAGPNPAAAELEKLWEDDPRKAVQVEIMAAMSFRDQQEANVDNQINLAATKYPDFKEHDQTVRQYIRALPLQQRAKPGVVDLAYYVVKGQNSGNAVEAAKAEVLRKIQAGEEVQGLPGGTKPAPPVVPVNTPTAEMLAVAEQMGLTADEYMSGQVAVKK